jgi:methionyl-tRNA formyltransferase
VLLGVWLGGVWVGAGRIQSKWDTDRHQAALVLAQQEQKSVDIQRSQEQINREISNEFNQRSVQLAADWQSVGFVRVRNRPEESGERVSAVPATPRSIAEAASNPVPVTSGDEGAVSCEQLSRDAAQTTLMFLEIQRWYELQSKIFNE